MVELNSWAHIIENGGPSLHGNTLEDGEYSKQDVVKLRDAVIGSDPGVVAVVPLWTLPHSTGKRQLWRVNSLIFYTEKRNIVSNARADFPVATIDELNVLFDHFNSLHNDTQRFTLSHILFQP